MNRRYHLLRRLAPALLSLVLACDDEGGGDGDGSSPGGLPEDGAAVCALFPVGDVAAATMMALDNEIDGSNDTPPRCSYETAAAGEPYLTIQIDAGSKWAGDKDFALEYRNGVVFDEVGVEGVLSNDDMLGVTELRFLSAADASVFIQWGDAQAPGDTPLPDREAFVVRAGNLVESALTN